MSTFHAYQLNREDVDREQWRESFDSMLCELLDDSDGVGL